MVPSPIEIVPPSLRRTWNGLVVGGVAVSILEMGCLGLVLAIVSKGSSDSAEVLPIVGGWSMEALAGSLLLAFAVKNGVGLWLAHSRERCARRSAVLLSDRLLRSYLAAPYPFHLAHNSSDLIRNVRESVDTLVYTMLAARVGLLRDALIAIGTILFLLLAAPPEATWALLLTVVIATGILALTQRLQSRWGKEALRLHGSLLRRLREAFDGFKQIRVHGLEETVGTRISEERAALATILERRGVMASVPRALLEFLFLGAVIAIALTTGDRTSATASLAIFLYAGFRLLPAAASLMHHLHNLRYGRGALSDLTGDFWHHAQGADGVDRSRPSTVAPRLSRALEVLDLRFQYPESPEETLRDISLIVRKGECIGIAGTTGAGKSTLVDILLGLLPYDSGNILIDGVELRGHETSWQEQVAYVPQQTFLIDGTIAANVALGGADATLDGTKLEAALRGADLLDWVRTLPGGIDTEVGENGIRVSGGQRQRLALARALYRDPAILFLDEATDGLDSETETRVLDRIVPGRTVILVSHRPAVLERCDRIVRLRDGRPVPA